MLGSFSFFLTSTLSSFSCFFLFIYYIFIDILSFLHLMKVKIVTFGFSYTTNQWLFIPLPPVRLIKPLGTWIVFCTVFLGNSVESLFSKTFWNRNLSETRENKLKTRFLISVWKLNGNLCFYLENLRYFKLFIWVWCLMMTYFIFVWLNKIAICLFVL